MALVTHVQPQASLLAYNYSGSPEMTSDRPSDGPQGNLQKELKQSFFLF